MNSDINSLDSHQGKRYPDTTIWSVVLGLAIILGCVLVFLFDPSQNSFFPKCPFHQLTGWNCPACGSTRAAHHLLHGHLAEAIHCNVLFVASLPLMGLLLVRWRLGKLRETVFTRPAGLWLLLTVAVVFSILRNLPFPAFAWMSP